MSDEVIPDDVLKDAMLHLRSMEQDVEERADGTWKVKGFGVRNAIARAILAERERCARVAEKLAAERRKAEQERGFSPSSATIEANTYWCEEIAQAIRSSS